MVASAQSVMREISHDDLPAITHLMHLQLALGQVRHRLGRAARPDELERGLEGVVAHQRQVGHVVHQAVVELFAGQHVGGKADQPRFAVAAVHGKGDAGADAEMARLFVQGVLFLLLEGLRLPHQRQHAAHAMAHGRVDVMQLFGIVMLAPFLRIIAVEERRLQVGVLRRQGRIQHRVETEVVRHIKQRIAPCALAVAVNEFHQLTKLNHIHPPCCRSRTGAIEFSISDTNRS